MGTAFFVIALCITGFILFHEIRRLFNKNRFYVYQGCNVDMLDEHGCKLVSKIQIKLMGGLKDGMVSLDKFC